MHITPTTGMESDGLLLIGSRPPSAQQNHTSQSSSKAYMGFQRPEESTYNNEYLSHNNFPQRDHSARSHHGRSTPERKVAFGGAYQAPHPSCDKGRDSRSKKSKHNPSYVDETLFGSSSARATSTDPAWPWPDSYRSEESHRANTPTRSGSHTPHDYKSRPVSRGEVTSRTGLVPSTPKSSRPSTSPSSRPASPNVNSPKKRVYKHTPSYVDETLFGPKLADPEFDAPWENKPKDKMHMFDYTDYKMRGGTVKTSATPGILKSSPLKSRPDLHCHLSHQASGSTLTANSHIGSSSSSTKTKHNPSYVEESLFGTNPVDADWPAPWEKPEDRCKAPLVYDAFEHKKVISHPHIETVKPRNKYVEQMRKSRSGSTMKDAKPVWK